MILVAVILAPIRGKDVAPGLVRHSLGNAWAFISPAWSLYKEYQADRSLRCD